MQSAKQGLTPDLAAKGSRRSQRMGPAARDRRGEVAFIVTRINVGDYDRWKPMFDKDEPGARRSAKGHRVLRGIENPNEVFVVVEFNSAEDAKAGRERLVDSGVLNRFLDKDLPKVVEEVEIVAY